VGLKFGCQEIMIWGSRFISYYSFQVRARDSFSDPGSRREGSTTNVVYTVVWRKSVVWWSWLNTALWLA